MANVSGRRLTWDEAQTARARNAAGETIDALAHEYDLTPGSMWTLIQGVTYRTEDGSRAPYRMSLTGCVARNGMCHGNGHDLRSWLLQRGCDQRTINRITHDRKWRFGSYRPSDRAALLVDSSAVLTPYAPDVEAA